MKHRRSIDLTPTEDGTEFDWQTIESLPQWYCFVASCGKCNRYEEVRRSVIVAKCRAGVSIGQLASKLRCQYCDNRNGNKLRVYKMGRG